MITPGGNPVCPECGQWYLGAHLCVAEECEPPEPNLAAF